MAEVVATALEAPGVLPFLQYGCWGNRAFSKRLLRLLLAELSHVADAAVVCRIIKSILKLDDSDQVSGSFILDILRAFYGRKHKLKGINRA